MSGYSRRKIGRAAFYAAAVGALILDQASKIVARLLLEPGLRVDVIPGFFTLRLIENRGAAFGAFSSWPPLLILISIAAIIAIVALRRERAKSRVLAVSLGLLLGGALGNLIDRIFLGYVTDFLDFGLRVGGSYLSWPTFNLADVSITAGVILLLYHLLVFEKNEEESKVNSRNE